MKVANYILKNHLILDELQEQIEATRLKLKIPQSTVEKDLYVTDIIHTVIPIQHDYYRLVFQGGTCLALKRTRLYRACQKTVISGWK